MKPTRISRVNRMLQVTLAEMIPSLVKDPRVQRLAMISITEVRTSPDLKHAKVYVSMVADPEQQERAMEGLDRARGFLRSELGRRVDLRYLPELQFVLDETQEEAARIERILGELAAEAPPREQAEDAGCAGDEALERVAEAIRDGRRFLVTSHPSPDGDAIGSMAAVLLVLEGMGREVVAYIPEPVPRRFQFVVGTERFCSTLPVELEPFDTTLILDCADNRMFADSSVEPAALGKVVVIDHHKTPGSVGDIVLRDPKAAAVGVLLFKIFSKLDVVLDKDVAEALFCSVMSDTGSFRYQNADPEALHVAAALLEHGVDPWHVSSNLYEERPRRELELLGLVLQTLNVSSDGFAACLTVTEQMLAQTGCTPDVIDGFINYARGIRGVEVAILLRPGSNGVRVSLRSRGKVDVSEIAQRFGGGGHHNAAGCSLEAALADRDETDRSDDLERIRAGLFAEVSRLLAERST